MTTILPNFAGPHSGRAELTSLGRTKKKGSLPSQETIKDYAGVPKTW